MFLSMVNFVVAIVAIAVGGCWWVIAPNKGGFNLAEISVSYESKECDHEFYFSKPINTGFIWESLNVMVDVLRLMGFGDDLIEDWIGSTYFTEHDSPRRDW